MYLWTSTDGRGSGRAAVTVHRVRGRKSQQQTAAVLRRDNYQCQIQLLPGCTQRATQKDHIISLEDGGTDAMSNMQAACEYCNRRKGSASGSVFLASSGTGNASFRRLPPLFDVITGDLSRGNGPTSD